MDYKEIQAKSTVELETELHDLKSALQNLIFKTSERQMKNVREIRRVRKEIAQIQTELSWREDTAV